MSQAKSSDDPEPTRDWESLSEFNFLLYRRSVDGLNAALAALDVAALPGSGGKSPRWWYTRSREKIEAVLNLSMAWSWLIQYKNGIELPDQVIRSFLLQELLDWLNIQLQLKPPLSYDEDLKLKANKQSIQEAILLLYSVAGSQGRPRLQIMPEATGLGVAVYFARLRRGEAFPSVEALLDSFSSHWRDQSIAFELRTAQDFLSMNHIELKLEDDGEAARFIFHIPKKPKSQSKAETITLAATRLTELGLDTSKPKENATILLRPKNQWHLPDMSHRVDFLDLCSPKASSPHDTIPKAPLVPGGWHYPTYPSSKKTIEHPTNQSQQRTAIIESDQTTTALSSDSLPKGSDRDDKASQKGTVDA